MKIYDNYLKKEIVLQKDVYIDSDGRLVIVYESEPQNYGDFGNTEESVDWIIGDKNHFLGVSDEDRDSCQSSKAKSKS